jgi:hypothetical protein
MDGYCIKRDSGCNTCIINFACWRSAQGDYQPVEVPRKFVHPDERIFFVAVLRRGNKPPWVAVPQLERGRGQRGASCKGFWR